MNRSLQQFSMNSMTTSPPAPGTPKAAPKRASALASPEKVPQVLRESFLYSIQKKKSSTSSLTPNVDEMSKQRFIHSQSAHRIVSPYKKVQRESLGAHNINILSLKHVGGHDQLYLSNDLAPVKTHYPLFQQRPSTVKGQTLRTEIVIGATMKNKQDALMSFMRKSMPNINKPMSSMLQIKSKKKPADVLNKSTNSFNNMDASSAKVNGLDYNESEGKSRMRLSTEGDYTSGSGANRQSGAVSRSNPGMIWSLVTIPEQEQMTSDLNSQVDQKVKEVGALNAKIAEKQDEKTGLMNFIEEIKREIACEKLLIEGIKARMTKASREQNIKNEKAQRHIQTSLHTSLEIQKQFKEFKQFSDDLEAVRSHNQRVLDQIEEEKEQIEFLKKQVLARKRNFIEETKSKEKIMKELHFEHKTMIAKEKIYIDQVINKFIWISNISNSRIYHVSENTLQPSFLSKNNLNTSRDTNMVLRTDQTATSFGFIPEESEQSHDRIPISPRNGFKIKSLKYSAKNLQQKQKTSTQSSQQSQQEQLEFSNF